MTRTGWYLWMTAWVCTVACSGSDGVPDSGNCVSTPLVEACKTAPDEDRIAIILDTDMRFLGESTITYEGVTATLDLNSMSQGGFSEQYALAYMISRGDFFDVRGVTVVGNGTDGIEAYAREASNLLQLLASDVPVLNGIVAATYTAVDANDETQNAAAKFLLREAAHQHAKGRQLHVLTTGRLSNIALALDLDTENVMQHVKLHVVAGDWPVADSRARANLIDQDFPHTPYNVARDAAAAQRVVQHPGEMRIISIVEGAGMVEATRNSFATRFSCVGRRVSPSQSVQTDNQALPPAETVGAYLSMAWATKRFARIPVPEFVAVLLFEQPDLIPMRVLKRPEIADVQARYPGTPLDKVPMPEFVFDLENLPSTSEATAEVYYHGSGAYDAAESVGIDVFDNPFIACYEGAPQP